MFADLYKAIKAKNEEKAVELIAKINTKNLAQFSEISGFSLLMLAIQGRMEKACELLINRMPDEEINRISTKEHTTLDLAIDLRGGKDNIFNLLLNKVSEDTIRYTFKGKTKNRKAFIRKKILENNEKAKKLAIFLKKSFEEENGSTDVIKIVNATKFYEIVNKDLLKKYLIKEQGFYLTEEEGVNNVESILIKMDNFIKENSFLIKGICKINQPDSKNLIPYLPDELLQSIVSYLDEEKWGIDAEVKSLGESN